MITALDQLLQKFSAFLERIFAGQPATNTPKLIDRAPSSSPGVSLDPLNSVLLPDQIPDQAVAHFSYGGSVGQAEAHRLIANSELASYTHFPR